MRKTGESGWKSGLKNEQKMSEKVIEKCSKQNEWKKFVNNWSKKWMKIRVVVGKIDLKSARNNGWKHGLNKKVNPKRMNFFTKLKVDTLKNWIEKFL